LLVLDSLARFASALRESAAAAGEPAGRAGYPPSVFAEMARFVERAGTARSGSITMLATVLSDGDERDPVSDAARSLLDGHIQLSAALAHAGHFPAIDVPASASRSMATIASGPHAANASVVRSAVAALSRSEDARALGVPAADPFTQRAAAAEPELEAFLRQDSAPTPPERTLSILAGLADTLR
jgi:flagellar biosynthesis/type III secretory pathway ATPase